MEKLIITAAITGSITVPSQTPYLPVTPQQIADEVFEAEKAGASVVHLHVRDPETGQPSSSLELYGELLEKIKDSSVIACITTGGAHGMTFEERVAAVPKYRPEMASFNCGSMNFALHPIAERIDEFKFDWEDKYLQGSKDFVFKNTFTDLELLCNTMKEYGTKPELEVYDLGQLYNVAYLVKEGILELPIHIQFVMGVLGGVMPVLEDLIHLRSTADRLFEGNYTWSVLGVGYPMEFHLGALALMMGGHVRVGLEDNIRLEKGVLAKSNAQLVEKMIRIARELGRDIANPEEARKILGLKPKK